MQAVLDAFGRTGLVGTLGYRLLNADDTEYRARTTTGIAETPAGSGCYNVDLPVGDLAGRTIVWDSGGAEPLYASEAFPDDLDAYAGVASASRTVRDLAVRAHVLYDKMPETWYRDVLLMGVRTLVAEVGGIYTSDVSLALVAAQEVYELPAAVRRIGVGTVQYVPSSGDPQDLQALTEAEVRALDDTGTPLGYAVVDRWHLRVRPTLAAVTTETLTFTMDALPAASYTYDTAIPFGPEIERPLMAYAIADAAAMMGDWSRHGYEKKQYEQVVDRLKREAVSRSHAPIRMVPQGSAVSVYTEDEEDWS